MGMKDTGNNTDSATAGNKDQLPFEVKDFDDLVFKERNREYGAYLLRKRYNKVLLTGVIVAVFLVSAIVIIPFLAGNDKEDILFGRGGYSVQLTMDNLEPPPQEKIYVPPPPPRPESSKPAETVKYVAPVIIDSVLQIDEKPITTDEALISQKDQLADLPGGGQGDDLFDGIDGAGSGEPLFVVEIMPSFRGGGLTKFMEWVATHTTYPREAIEKKIRGTVFLTFIVEKDGSVSNVTVIKGVHPLLDEEAKKTISESPKWTPGLQRGHPVRVIFRIPLNFV
jgi:protein TonB